MFGLVLLYVFFCPFSILITCLGKRELVFMLIVHLFVSYAHVNLCHFFSSSWCRGLAAASACGSSWTFLFQGSRCRSPLSPNVKKKYFWHKKTSFGENKWQKKKILL